MNQQIAPLDTDLQCHSRFSVMSEAELDPNNFCESLTESGRSFIEKYGSARTLPKGEYLVEPGGTLPICYSVLSGYVRQYYIVDGEEKTTYFFMEGQTIFPPHGSDSRTPVDYYLQCEEEVTLTYLTPENRAELFRLWPILEILSRKSLEQELGHCRELLSIFVTKSPQERYEHLIKTRPELLMRVPQYHLASFIGVRPESFSRIRRRVVTGKKAS